MLHDGRGNETKDCTKGAGSHPPLCSSSGQNGTVLYRGIQKKPRLLLAKKSCSWFNKIVLLSCSQDRGLTRLHREGFVLILLPGVHL